MGMTSRSKREPPAEETEDQAAAVSLERDLSAGVAAQETVIQAAAARETEPPADANDADDDCVIVEAAVITRSPLKPFPRFVVARWDNPLKW